MFTMKDDMYMEEIVSLSMNWHWQEKIPLALEGQSSGPTLLSLEQKRNNIQCFYHLRVGLLLQYNISDKATRIQVYPWMQENGIFAHLFEV